MAVNNTLLNSSIITNAALAILHQKLNFIGSINRAYDNSFAIDGAKIGSALRIRLPNQYVVRSGPTLSPQPVVENQITLNVTSQKGVDLSFSSTELTMNIMDFSHIILEPAMAQLAAAMEADALNMAADVYNQVNGQGAAQTFKNILQARKILVDNLAPSGEKLVRINTTDNVDLVDSLKGLFQSSTNIKEQYLDGVMGHTGGFEFAENTFLGTYLRGAESATYVLNGVPASGATSAVVATGTGTGNQGDVFTIAGVFRVHPETKASTGVLQQFVLTAAYAGGAGTIAFSPALNYAVTGVQNVSAAPATNAALVFAGTISTASGLSLAYAKDAFTFATADLVLPSGVDMSARKVQDGLSMRLVRQYDINNDLFPVRFDVLYGYKTLRPQLAVRLAAN
jgi:P22 coat protein - gene protein 5